MSISWTRLPFRYRTTQEFESELMDLISRAFYETLPASGFEIREEQAYTAYRIARSVTAGQTYFAEAGSGTGKTFAYLIPAVCHARRVGKPVVIACASSVLQKQLLDPGGDVATLSRLLGLDIDARLASDPQNYVCEQNVAELSYTSVRKKGLAGLRQWAQTSKTGERGEIPDVPDDLWALAAWTESMPCDTCKRRGFCRMIRAREHYRASTDLIVCSHDMFFRDLWTRTPRQAEGLMPVLPEYGGVVFDEGHLVPDVARDTAGHSFNRVILENTLTQLAAATEEYKEYLPQLVIATHSIGRVAAEFWNKLAEAASCSATERWHLVVTPELLQAAGHLADVLESLEDRIALAEDLLSIEIRERLLTLQLRLDEATEALGLLIDGKGQTALYAEHPADPGAAIWAVPRRIDRLMERELYSQKVPVIFTSATLAVGGSFDYLKRTVGAGGALSASAGTPFDFARQELIYMPSMQPSDRVAHLIELLHATEGRALILCNTPAEVKRLRTALGKHPDLPWTVFWEGDAERADLLRRFRDDTHSVLVGTSFWEGIDVRGEALSCVAVLQLPFPPDDPLLVARREEACGDGLNPDIAVDLPEMALKLKQGCGRLIRTATDRGVFALLDVSHRGASFEAAVEGAFPEASERTDDLTQVGNFLAGGRRA